MPPEISEYLNEILFGSGASVATLLAGWFGVRRGMRQTATKARGSLIAAAKYLASLKLEGVAVKSLTIGDAIAILDQKEIEGPNGSNDVPG